MRGIALYHRLHPRVRSLPASVHGYLLRRRRYGKEFRDALPGAVDRAGWDRERLGAYADAQVRRLMEVVPHAPFYRDRFASLGIQPHRIDSVAALVEAAPVTEKSDLRERPQDFVDDRLARSALAEVHTSGTTGTPLRLYRDRAADGLAHAYFEARWRLPYGVTRQSSWTMLGGKLVVPQEQERPPFWVHNAGLNQRYMSVHHLAPRFAADYVRELRRKPTDYLYGYSSALYWLALMVRQENAEDISFKVLISNAEPLYDYQRELIQDVFQCPVKATYGCTEWCCQGSECLHGRMHISPDVGVFELLNDRGSPCRAGESGDVVCTSFVNFAQPLIRYRVGDRAVWAADPQCPCGSQFPVLERVDGRREDVILLEDGRRLGTMTNLFKGHLPIVEAQVVQESLDEFTFNVVPGREWDERSARAMRQQARAFLGNVRINIQRVDSIPRDGSGKYRATISRLRDSSSAREHVRG